MAVAVVVVVQAVERRRHVPTIQVRFHWAQGCAALGKVSLTCTVVAKRIYLNKIGGTRKQSQAHSLKSHGSHLNTTQIKL